MKKIPYIFIFLLAQIAASAQVAKGTGVFYFSAEPTLPVDVCYDGEVGIDTTTGLWWEYSRDFGFWILAGFRVQKLTGCAAPSYTPADKQSEVVLNDCDSLYRWRAGAWWHLNPVSVAADGSETIVTAGTGISVTGNGTSGTPYVVTNTGDLSTTNEIQNLTYAPATGYMAISGGTGDTINLMGGATSSTDGERGLVGKPVAGDEAKFWRGDGTWANPSVGGDNWGSQVVLTEARLTGNGTGANKLDIAQQGATSGQALKWNGTTWVPQNDADTDAQNLTIEGGGPTYDIAISGGTDVTIAGAGIVTLSESPANTLIVSAAEVDGSVTNEGSLTVGAGGANSSTIVSNTSGSTAVTVAGAGIVTVTESGSTITVTGTEVDGSTTNEAWTVDADDADTELITTQTVKFQGGGITVTDYIPGTDILTITSTEVDGSTSNELQTLNNTGDATSHTATLSNSGGSLKLKEGTNITLTTDVTGLNGEVTISATPTSDGNGIYGDGTTPGSGSDNLPPGGSTVTIPGHWQPLNFAIDASSGTVITGLRVTTDYCDDATITKYLVGKSPSDSLELYNFDCAGVIKETGGTLTLETDREMYLVADSINMATVPTRTVGAAILAQDASGFVRKIPGTSVGHILKWDGTNWALGTDNTGSGLTGAENGLSVSGANARLGGTLLTTTIINQAGFDFRTHGGKVSHQQYTGFSYTPTQPFGASGHENNPTTGASPTSDGIAEFVATTSGGSDQPNSLTVGAYTTDATGVWMQARSRSVPNFYYPLALNPNGGNVGVGTSTTAPHSTLQTAGSLATAYLETVGAPTFDATKHTVAYTANVNISWTLPSAATCACAGRVYILHHVGTAGTITLSQSISKGNGTTFNTLTAGQWAYIVYGSSAIRGYKLTSL